MYCHHSLLMIIIKWLLSSDRQRNCQALFWELSATLWRMVFPHNVFSSSCSIPSIESQFQQHTFPKNLVSSSVFPGYFRNSSLFPCIMFMNACYYEIFKCLASCKSWPLVRTGIYRSPWPFGKAFSSERSRRVRTKSTCRRVDVMVR